MNDEKPEADPKSSTNENEDPPKVISTEALFAGTREICLEHEGEIYRLRITRRGKLILQK